MLKKISVALIAASLIAGPALAQGTAAGTNTGPAAQTDTAKPALAKVKKTKQHSSKMTKKHVSQIKHVKRHVAKRSAKPASTTGSAVAR